MSNMSLFNDKTDFCHAWNTLKGITNKTVHHVNAIEINQILLFCVQLQVINVYIPKFTI